MKFISIFVIIGVLLFAGCSTGTQNDNVQSDIGPTVERPAEMQDDEDTDHMSVVGNTNQFVNIVGKRNNLSVKVKDAYYHGDAKGFYARPDDDNEYPGVVLIHEWWGLNDHIKELAVTLASEGYSVLAVDLYDGEVAETSEQARELRTSINQTEAINNMKAAIAFLKVEAGVTRVASMGFCFGGEQSAQLSMSDANLDATVIFYGSLPQESEDIAKVDTPVLGIFGELDTGITPDTVRTFQAGLNELGMENSITIYDGVGHAFVNPGGSRFAEKETKDAWNKTLDFLETNLN